MSGIFGCMMLDGAPADRVLLERMRDRLAHRGPDGSGLWIDGRVGLGHLAFHTTPESAREHQPLASADGLLHLALDGRVDNREEMLADLRARGFEPREDTDAELVLEAYRCWGAECPARIVGDFAFAIWDAGAGKLFCARDAVGIRQFFFFSDGRIFLWATEWGALFEHAAVSRTPNESVLAQYLCNCFTTADDTLFRDVARLPAAHSLTLSSEGLRLRRYWDVDLRRAICYRSDGEYAEHFRSVFREAVRCRLRSQAPVAVDLSGGLDSSAIVGMAQALREERAAQAPPLEVYTLAFPGLPCDERPFVEAVARRWNLTPHFCEGAILDLDAYRAQAREGFGLPFSPNGTMADPMRRLQGEHGVRVVLEGGGGDEWLTGGFYRLADLLRRGRVLALAREMIAGRKVQAFEHSPKDVLRYGVWPLLPLNLRLALRTALGRTGARPLIGPALARHLPPVAALCNEPVLGDCLSFDQAEMLTVLRATDCQRGYEEVDRSAARQRWEVRSPFMDRRVIELAFALPPEQRWRNARTKYVLREAMRGLLPEPIAARTDKADFSHTIVETLRRGNVNFCPGNSTLERLDWVDGAALRRVYSDMLARYNKRDPSYTANAWPIWCAFTIETWMEEVVLRAAKDVP